MRAQWIFLRGLSRETRHWDSFFDKFKNKLQVNVECIDLPGTGKFYRDRSPATIGEITDHVQRQCSKSEVWILAHSMGSIVATEWMRREPQRILGGVLANASFAGVSPIYNRLRVKGFLSFVKFVTAQSNLRAREEIKFSITCKNQQKKNETIQKWMAIQNSQPVTVATTWNQLNAAAWYPNNHKPIQPILLLNSLGDDLVHPDCTKELAQHWGAPFKTHSWAGHDIFHDDEDWCVDAIQEWHQSLDSGGKEFK